MYFLNVSQSLMFYVLIEWYDVKNKLFLNKMSIFCTIYTFVLFMYTFVLQCYLADADIFSVTQFFGFNLLTKNLTK